MCETIRKNILLIAMILCIVPAAVAAHAATEDIVNTKHNLSVSGPGPIKALTETRICVFCHTPHNATPQTPLWNKDVEPQTYNLYTSSTLKATLSQPYGPTKLCLTCHDGTVATGAVVNPAGGISMAGSSTISPGSYTYFGLNLSSHHPVAFNYSSSIPNAELYSTPPPNLEYGDTDEVHCTTCHDPHDDTYGMFLAMDNDRSALCISCHNMTGWSSSGHATSSATVSGILPIPPKTWPTAVMWPTVADWGCEICHTPHFAANPEWLLNYSYSPTGGVSDFCLTCHSPVPAPPSPIHGAPASAARVAAPVLPMINMADIRGQVNKISAHREQPGLTGMSVRSAKDISRSGIRNVTCVDCHNPHMANKQKAVAPAVSGMLQGVSGIDRNGMEVSSASYEYEICFKCHGDYNSDFIDIPRVINTTNTRLAFSIANPSYHPVVGMGKNLNIPSIPSSLNPSLKASDIIYCSTCHRDDSGVSKGPHGSSYPPILRDRYETNDNTPESYASYALCYRCHERRSILSDASFRKKILRKTATGGGHSGHLANGAPCSACHDPHGVSIVSASAIGTGSHTHLINFDTRIVSPLPGSKYPIFIDRGMFSGSCTLVCHGRVHNNETYP